MVAGDEAHLMIVLFLASDVVLRIMTKETPHTDIILKFPRWQAQPNLSFRQTVSMGPTLPFLCLPPQYDFSLTLHIGFVSGKKGCGVLVQSSRSCIQVCYCMCLWE